MNFDDDEGFGGLYENGRWSWDNKENQIVFLSNPRSKSDDNLYTYTEPTAAIEFREDVDLIEQMRYRRHFQRKLQPGQPNIVTLQDVKDLVLYTAPPNILSENIIDMLHTATGERFLRALILYCAYSIQVAEKMLSRTLELETKIRTSSSDILEAEYRDNLADLRILVAKEYATIICGAGDMKPFHHMGPLKTRRSYPIKDARLFETFIQISVQIVYVSLGRKYFHQIESETNRLLKSDTFSAVKHKSLITKALKSPAPSNTVMTGACLCYGRQYNTHSPLMNEIFCPRPVDYRMLGLGLIKYPNLTHRLLYFYLAVAAKEETMAQADVIVSIIGMPRTKFDTMLKALPVTTTPDRKSKSFVLRSIQSVSAKSSSMKKNLTQVRFFPEIVIPPKTSVESVPPIEFPDEPEDINPVNQVQRHLWQNRLKKTMSLLNQRRKHS